MYFIVVINYYVQLIYMIFRNKYLKYKEKLKHEFNYSGGANDWRDLDNASFVKKILNCWSSGGRNRITWSGVDDDLPDGEGHGYRGWLLFFGILNDNENHVHMFNNGTFHYKINGIRYDGYNIDDVNDDATATAKCNYIMRNFTERYVKTNAQLIHELLTIFRKNYIESVLIDSFYRIQLPERRKYVLMNYEGRILYYNEYHIISDFMVNTYTNNDAYLLYDNINHFINS